MLCSQFCSCTCGVIAIQSFNCFLVPQSATCCSLHLIQEQNSFFNICQAMKDKMELLTIADAMCVSSVTSGAAGFQHLHFLLQCGRTECCNVYFPLFYSVFLYIVVRVQKCFLILRFQFPDLCSVTARSLIPILELKRHVKSLEI